MLNESPEMRAVRTYEDTPQHLDKTPPKKLPQKIWKRMTSSQREEYSKWVREYIDRLADETRADRRKTHGF